MTAQDIAWSLAIHGGAGAVRSARNDAEIAHMGALLDHGSTLLDAGASALDVVADLAEAMEGAGLYVAGKGSMPNVNGAWELDAAIMHGPTQRAGAVAALKGFVSPIRAARAVMEETTHVLLAGAGASAFCLEQGLAPIGDAQTYYTPASSSLANATGTIGVIARDLKGELAAATSTGGVSGKRPGRVGDSPLIGAGTWADDRCAVSCTGQGEYFMRVNAAAELARRLRLTSETLNEAADRVLSMVATLGGKGGLIAMDAEGAVTAPFNTQGMRRARADSTGLRDVRIFA